MHCKELWFVRHTETETPGNFDFDLSRKGKRHARMLGWYMAKQNVAKPVAVLRFDYLRAESMAHGLMEYLARDNSDKVKNFLLPQGVSAELMECFESLLNITFRLDNLASFFGGQSPQAAVYVIHRQYEAGFHLLRFMLAAEKSKNLITSLDEQTFSLAGDDWFNNYHREFDNGELVRMRFPVSAWKDICVGSGEIIAQETPKTVRPAYKAWRQEQRALRLQQPSQ